MVWFGTSTYLWRVLNRRCIWSVSGKDIYAEESHIFSHFCGDSNPLPVPRPPWGSRPLNQMVCIAEWMFYTTFKSYFHLFCDTKSFFVLICRFNISPLSVNISTTEFSLLASSPKVNLSNSPVELMPLNIYSLTFGWRHASDFTNIFAMGQWCLCCLPYQFYFLFVFRQMRMVKT